MFTANTNPPKNDTPGLANALADNNARPGYQPTLALQANSPALGTGDPNLAGQASPLGIDERGYSRPGNVSIGAYDPGAKIAQLGPSSTTVTSSVNPAMPNQAVVFTATVSGDNGTPTGTVTFMLDNVVMGEAPLDDNGNATFTTSLATLGDHNITAVYNGDGNYESSAGFMTQTISRMATGIMLSSDVNPSQPGDNVTFLVGVEAADGVSGPPTGIVTFYNGTNFLGTAPLDATGGATFMTSFDTGGNYNITAIYSGDDSFAGSSASELQTVGQPSTDPNALVLLDSSANPSLPGQGVTLTVTVNGDQSGVPTGTITFFDGTTVLGTVPLDANGNATFMTPALALGDHNITAIYSGDSTYAGSTGDITQSVVQQDTTTSLSADVNPSPLGQTVTFTITVAPADMGPGMPTGTVDIYDGTTLLGTATLSPVDGQMQATFATDALGLGSHTILAIYSGDSTYADSGASLQETID